MSGEGFTSEEDVAFGDGVKTGANAGAVPCSAGKKFATASRWVHVYRAPGRYQFRDQVAAIGMPPECRAVGVVGRATIVVAPLG
jgi:hypothetical protein